MAFLPLRSRWAIRIRLSRVSEVKDSDGSFSLCQCYTHGISALRARAGVVSVKNSDIDPADEVAAALLGMVGAFLIILECVVGEAADEDRQGRRPALRRRLGYCAQGRPGSSRRSGTGRPDTRARP